MKSKKETRYAIILAFEFKEDQQEVLKQMKKKKTISWSNDTREANLTQSKLGRCVINVSKSKINVPKPIRL